MKTSLFYENWVKVMKWLRKKLFQEPKPGPIPLPKPGPIPEPKPGPIPEPKPGPAPDPSHSYGPKFDPFSDPETIESKPKRIQDPGFFKDALKPDSEIDVSRSEIIEKEIRKAAPTINRIKFCLTQAAVTDYQIHEKGKVGVNTQVFATAPGIRVPVEGVFLCFIARPVVDKTIKQPEPKYYKN